MNFHTRKDFLYLLLPLFCLFRITCVSSLKTHFSILDKRCKASLKICLHSLQHSTSGLLLASYLGKSIQLLTLELQHRLQIQNGTYCSCSRCDPAALFQIFQGFQSNINTGIKFLFFQDCLNLSSALTCITKGDCIHHRLTLGYRNSLIINHMYPALVFLGKSHSSGAGSAKSA